MSESTIALGRVERLILDLRAGRQEARDELLVAAGDRLMAVTRKIKRSFPQVGRWEQTEDVFQNASLRLYRAMADVELKDSLHFYRLAALQIRRELLDMVRSLEGPRGLARNHHSQLRLSGDESGGPPAFDPAQAAEDSADLSLWVEFHQAVETLPESEREVTELIWYHGLPHSEIAQLLGVDERTVRRRWRRSRLALHEKLSEGLPDLSE